MKVITEAENNYPEIYELVKKLISSINHLEEKNCTSIIIETHDPTYEYALTVLDGDEYIDQYNFGSGKKTIQVITIDLTELIDGSDETEFIYDKNFSIEKAEKYLINKYHNLNQLSINVYNEDTYEFIVSYLDKYIRLYKVIFRELNFRLYKSI